MSNMEVTSPLPSIIALLLAFGVGSLLVKRFGSPPDKGRFATIDGLRGYLAFLVFLHHAVIWYFFLRTGRWEVPPSNLYTHFGQTSVAFFFMITGFLFYTKLLDGRKVGIDWGRLYVSRFLRLFPLYALAIGLMLCVLAWVSDFALQEPLIKIVKDLFRWLTFTMVGAPDLNGFQQTSMILAGVVWSLPYEWFFYFSLPLLALSIGIVPPATYLLLGLIAGVGFWCWGGGAYHLAAFLGGIVAALAARVGFFCRIARMKASSVLIVFLIGVAVARFSTAYAVVPLLLLALAFALMAAGNDVFGVLVNKVSRTLGEMAYSIYLLHGIVLFVTFRLILGLSLAATFSPMQHWLTICCLVPLLLAICYATFRFVEYPAMHGTNRISRALQSVSLDSFRK